MGVPSSQACSALASGQTAARTPARVTPADQSSPPSTARSTSSVLLPGDRDALSHRSQVFTLTLLTTETSSRLRLIFKLLDCNKTTKKKKKKVPALIPLL